MMPERPEKMETDAPYMGGYGDYTISTVDMIYNCLLYTSPSPRDCS